MKKMNKLILNGLNKHLELKVVTAINIESDTEFIYIEKLKSGDWRLAFTSKTIPNIEELKSIDLDVEYDKKTVKNKNKAINKKADG